MLLFLMLQLSVCYFGYQAATKPTIFDQSSTVLPGRSPNIYIFLFLFHNAISHDQLSPISAYFFNKTSCFIELEFLKVCVSIFPFNQCFVSSTRSSAFIQLSDLLLWCMSTNWRYKFYFFF